MSSPVILMPALDDNDLAELEECGDSACCDRCAGGIALGYAPAEQEEDDADVVRVGNY